MDNQDVLDLVSYSKRPRGLLQMLDEEIRVPGGNSQTFVKKFKKLVESHSIRQTDERR